MPTTKIIPRADQGDELTFRLPILPIDYSDRNPALSEEERRGIESLISLSSAPHYRAFEQLAEKLARITKPLFDVLALYRQSRPKSPVSRKLFLGYFMGHVLRTNTLYWGWSKETWEYIIDTAPQRPCEPARRKEPGYININNPTHILVHLVAYLLADVIYLAGRNPFPARFLGEIIFGSHAMQKAITKAKEPWLATGYANERTSEDDLARAMSLALLVNHHPALEALTASTFQRLSEMDLRRKMVKNRVEQLHRVLIDLEILAPEAPRVKQAGQLFRAEHLTGIHPRWIAWLQAFWRQTPISLNARTTITNQMLVACRWLASHYPHITEPAQFTREIAVRYVAYTCNEATAYDFVSPAFQQRFSHLVKRRQTDALQPTGKSHRIQGVKSFFRSLQKYSYEVDGRMEPRLAINWNPADTLATPESVKAQIQPNPRNVQEEAWLKLVWTACTLNADMVKEILPGSKYPLALLRAVALVWVTACRRRDEIRRLPLDCVRREWAPEMLDENGVQIEPAEDLWYLLVPTNKFRGIFWSPIPQYTGEAILAWQAVRPKNQPLLPDRKTGQPTEYLFQYRRRTLGQGFINNHLIPLLCKAAGLVDEQGNPYQDAIGPITSHRARSSTAYYLKAMGMTPYDIGKLLGHTNPNRSLPWYLKENLHQLGRMYRKANPLDRTVHALLDTDAAGKGDPCVFYYLADSPEGRPRLCGNPNFRVCYHQLQCAECAAYIETEMAEVIEKRPGVLHMSVPIPLPEQLVEDLTKQEEGVPTGEFPPPPPIPSTAFHFNKKVIAQIGEVRNQNTGELDQLHARLVDLEAQLATKGKQDTRNVSIRLLKQEISECRERLAELETRQKEGGIEIQS